MTRDRKRRRLFLFGLAGLSLAGVLALPRSKASAQELLAPTPACDDGDEPTPEQTAGPFFIPNSPERSRLREGGTFGTPITLSGYVLTTRCKPIPNALVDIWHADHAGRYDLDGYSFRGHQFTDLEGRYIFETIVPGLYPGRTRHYHIRYQAPNGPILTTQLYFPGEPANAADRLFMPELMVQVTDEPRGLARFDAVLG